LLREISPKVSFYFERTDRTADHSLFGPYNRMSLSIKMFIEPGYTLLSAWSMKYINNARQMLLQRLDRHRGRTNFTT
jgi:hypothetical protein